MISEPLLTEAASQLITWPTRHMWRVDLLILHSAWRVDHTGVTSWLAAKWTNIWGTAERKRPRLRYRKWLEREKPILTDWTSCEWRYSLRRLLDSFLAAWSNDCHVASNCWRSLRTKNSFIILPHDALCASVYDTAIMSVYLSPCLSLRGSSSVGNGWTCHHFFHHQVVAGKHNGEIVTESLSPGTLTKLGKKLLFSGLGSS